MPYIGKSPVGGGFHKLDALTASATATYALTLGSAAYFPETANQLLVSLNGVIQAPQDSFTVSGSNLIFDTALTASDSIDFVVALGDVLGVGSVTDGAVTANKIGNGAVTKAKMGTTELDLATIKDSTGTNTAMTIDSSGSVNFPNTNISSIGFGQTWQDVNSSRAKATEYQNTTSLPIMVSIWFNGSFTDTGRLQVSTTSGSGFITISEADGGDYYSSSAYTTHTANVQAIIPVNHYYKIVQNGSVLNIVGWAELR